MNRMKILIGTPIHEVKDYAMERWLENVAKLQEVTPCDLLLVDNSRTQLDLFEMVLSGQYEVITASGGIEALRI